MDECKVHSVTEEARPADTACPCGCGTMMCRHCAQVLAYGLGKKLGPDGLPVEAK